MEDESNRYRVVKGRINREGKVVATCPFCQKEHTYPVSLTGFYICLNGPGTFEIRIWK